MKRTGYIFIAVSFLGSAYLSVLKELAMNWTWFIPAFIVGLIGVTFVQIAERRHTRQEDRVSSDVQVLEHRLQNVVENAHLLNQQKQDINIYDLHQKIDEVFIEDLNAFADRRESIAHAYDLQEYADIMSHFAAGERFLNRVWSTSVDGYIDEAHTFLEKAELQFTQALERLDTLGTRAGVTG